ncbi:MAG: NAD(P)-dependent oxidoreductase [Pseudomonadota bacterium]
MKAFPMFIKTTGRRVVIVGGGEQAVQKARLILKSDAELVFAALAIDPEIDALVKTGRATWFQGALTKDFFSGAAIVFIGTGCVAADASAHALAKAAHCQVNVVDQPDLCDITTPSLVDRDPVVIAIGTEGTAPVLARQIKTQIEQSLSQDLGGLAALAGRLRQSVAHRIDRSKRRAFWTWVFSGKPRWLWEQGAEAHAATLIKGAIENRFDAETSSVGALTVIDAGAGHPDMQTLLAVQRLQDADVIFCDAHAHDPILELARRDADRVYLGELNAHRPRITSWVQSRLIAEARKGRRVVFLTDRFQSYTALQTLRGQEENVPKIVTEFISTGNARVVCEDGQTGLLRDEVFGEQPAREALTGAPWM